MTRKQINQLRNTLPKYKNGIPPTLTLKQRQLEKELNCRDMINSILCYEGADNIINNKYLRGYISEIGLYAVQQLCAEQIADFKNATVEKNVHIDTEGVFYHTIVWADER